MHCVLASIKDLAMRSKGLQRFQWLDKVTQGMADQVFNKA